MRWTNKNEKEILDKVREFRKSGEDRTSDWRARGLLGHEFRIGKQWKAEEAAKLEKEGRPALTINHCLPITDWLCGVQRQNRKDMRASAVKNGSQLVARIWTAILKHANSACGADHEASEQFKDGITTGKGWVHLVVDKETDVTHGDLKVVKVSPFGVIEDLGAGKYDLNQGAKYIILVEWEDKEKLEAEYPDQKEALTNSSYKSPTDDESGGWFSSLISFLFRGGEDEKQNDWQKHQYEKQTTYWLEYKPVLYVADALTRAAVKLTKTADIGKAKKNAKEWPERYKVIERVGCVMNKTISANDVLLAHTEDPFRVGEGMDYTWEGDEVRIFDEHPLWPLVPYYAYFEDGYVMGKIDNLIGPQREENKRRSQFLHIINSVANSGWIYKVNSLSKKMLDTLKNFGASTGLMLEWTDEKPEKIQPQRAPDAHMVAAMTSKEDIKEIANVNTENLAYETQKGMSGVALSLKQQSGLTGNVIIYDNFDQTMQILALAEMQIIRCAKLYSQTEIEALLDKEDLMDMQLREKAMQVVGPPPQPPPRPSPVAIAALRNIEQQMGQSMGAIEAIGVEYERAMGEHQKAMAQYEESVRIAAQKILTEEMGRIRSGRYGVKLTEAPSTPTRRLANFMSLLELDKTRPGQIPLKTIIQASDMDQKERIIEDIEQQQQQSIMQGAA